MRRLVTFTIVVVLAVAATEACSLLLPYDDYAGHGQEAGGPVVDSSSPSVDSGAVVDSDLPVTDGGGGVPDACAGINLHTDSANCGACGRACVTGSCAAGKCPVDTLAPADPSAVVALDYETAPDVGPALYFTRESGALGRVITDGGAVEITTTTKATGPVFINANGARGIFGGTNSVWTFRTAGFATDTPDRITTRASLGPVLYAGSLAYFGDPTGILWATATANAMVDGAAGPAPVALATSDGRVYWAASDGQVFSMRAANPQTPALVVATGRTGLSAIAATTANLYLGHPGQGLVICNLDETTVLATESRIVSLDDVEAIASDGAHVYALDFPGNRATGRLLRMDMNGDELIVLAGSLTPSPHALTLAGNYVYFASGGLIQRTAK